MHPILVYSIEHVVGAYEVDVGEVSCVRLESGVSGLDAEEL